MFVIIQAFSLVGEAAKEKIAAEVLSPSSTEARRCRRRKWKPPYDAAGQTHDLAAGADGGGRVVLFRRT